MADTVAIVLPGWMAWLIAFWLTVEVVASGTKVYGAVLENRLRQRRGRSDTEDEHG